jgi:hypothetical protein
MHERRCSALRPRLGRCAPAGALFGAILAAPAAMAGPPFVTDDPDTPAKSHFEINLAAQFTRFHGGSTANVPSLEVNYGVLDNLEATVLVPMGLSQVSGVGTNVGFGDIELSFKYRFVEEDSLGWRPSIAIAPQVNLPSGSEARGLGAGRFTGFIPVWLSKDFNQWTAFGGGGPNINTGPDQKNWWFAGLGLLRELSPAWTVGGEVYYNSPEQTGQKNTMGFNLGLIYTISDNYQVLFSAGRNLINARDTNQFSTYSGMQFNF